MSKLTKQAIKNITSGDSARTGKFFYECKENGFAMIPSRLIRSGIISEAGAAFTTFCVLLDFANTKTYQCNPSVERIAELVGKTDRAVKKDLAKLEEINWIKKIPAPTVQGKHLYTNNYIIIVHEKLEEVAVPKKEVQEEMVQEVVEEVAVQEQPKKKPLLVKKVVAKKQEQQQEKERTILEIAQAMQKEILKQVKDGDAKDVLQRHTDNLITYIKSYDSTKDTFFLTMYAMSEIRIIIELLSAKNLHSDQLSQLTNRVEEEIAA